MKKLYLILFFVHIISSGLSAQGSKKAELTFPRRVVMEEFTGTWCGNCPRGMVGISRLAEDFGDKVISIAIHSGSSEPMQIYTYPSIQPSGGIPACMLNRGSKLDPYSGSGSRGYNHYGIDVDVAALLTEPAEADVALTAIWNDDNLWDVRFYVTTTFGFSSDEADYGLAFILLEDGLSGTGKQWMQTNYYSESYDSNVINKYGDDDMAVWREAPYYVGDMVYDHVPVNTYGIKEGISGSIKAPIVCGEKQGYTDIITTLNNKVIQDKSRLYAVVLLIDRTTGRIVNADRAEIQPYGTSAIETTVATQPADGKTYNLQGQQVTRPDSKGIYIRNGKKHLTK